MSLEKYCCGTLGTKATICGNEKRQGGIKHVFLLVIDQTTITDYTNTVQWQAAIANGDAILIEEVRGEYPEVSEVETDRLIGCGSETELDGFNHELIWQDRAVTAANNNFYEDLKECTFWFGWYDCQKGGTSRIHVVEEDVSFVPKPTVIDPNLNTPQRYMVKAKWSSPTFPQIFNAPAGIFS